MWSATTATCRRFFSSLELEDSSTDMGGPKVFGRGPWPHLWFLCTFPSARRTGGSGFFWSCTSETSRLVWWIFRAPTPRNNGWLLRWSIIGSTKDAASLQHLRHHQCCRRCVSMDKSFETFCRSEGIWVPNDPHPDPGTPTLSGCGGGGCSYVFFWSYSS